VRIYVSGIHNRTDEGKSRSTVSRTEEAGNFPFGFERSYRSFGSVIIRRNIVAVKNVATPDTAETVLFMPVAFADVDENAFFIGKEGKNSGEIKKISPEFFCISGRSFLYSIIIT
jgi:hypothetical protein